MKRITSVLVGLVLLGFSAFGQDVQISGKVTNAADGILLPGVSVVVKGTTTGITTNINGEYSLTVPSDAILVFSFIGMKSTEIPVGNQTTIDIAMESDVTGLDEVIVVGYGTSTKESSTGSVSVIKGNDVADVPQTSFEKMLAGKVSGMTVSSESGQPGANTQIRIRGISSINAGRDPLYVVDGVAITRNQTEDDAYYMTNSSNVLSIINPNDIKSISVLKDAAATAIYGSRAANGVIIITTKGGEKGDTKVNLRVKYGFNTLANDNDFGTLTPSQLLEYRRDAVVNAGEDPDDPSSSYYTPDSLLQVPTTNWLKEVLRTGKFKEYELSINGGNEKTTQYTSAKYQNTEGIFYGIDYDVYQVRSNIKHKVNDKLNYGVNMSVLHNEMNDVSMQDMYYANPIFAALAIDPWSPVRNDDGTYNTDISEWSNTNPVATAEYDEQSEKQNKLLGSGYLEWAIIKNLRLKSNNAIEYTNTEGRRYWSSEAHSGTATLQTTLSHFTQFTSSNTANYSYFKDAHSINAMAGFEFIKYADHFYFIYSPEVDGDIPYPNTSSSESDYADYNETKYHMASFFGIFDYNFASKYFLRASYRVDGSSKFGENNRWGGFYSAALSWNIQKESFMQNISAIDLMKVRISYGVSGNDDIGNYEQFGVYASHEYNGNVGMAPSQLENPNLTWETNKELNFALDFGLLEKITGSVEVYSRKTEDMLLDVPISMTSGFDSYMQNVGSIKNTGVEFLVNANILNGKLKWDAGFNLSHNKSEILDLAIDGGEFINDDNARIIHREGESVLSYYLYDWAGVNPLNGDGLWRKANGELTNDFSSLSTSDKKVMGSPEPKLTGGFNTNLRYMGISLSANFEFKYGNDVLIEELHYLNSDGYWFTKNQVSSALDYWKEPGDITENPKPIADNTTNSNAYYSSRWMYDGSYLRVKNVTLSYSLPQSIVGKLNIDNIRIYTSGLNLYTFHNVDWFDPERGEEGMGYGIYPKTKSLIFGIDVTF